MRFNLVQAKASSSSRHRRLRFFGRRSYLTCNCRAIDPENRLWLGGKGDCINSTRHFGRLGYCYALTTSPTKSGTISRSHGVQAKVLYFIHTWSISSVLGALYTFLLFTIVCREGQRPIQRGAVCIGDDECIPALLWLLMIGRICIWTNTA